MGNKNYVKTQADENVGEMGMMTVEVVICMTMFAAFFVIMLNLINVVYIKQKVQAALKPIVIQMSRDYYAVENLDYSRRDDERDITVSILQKRGQSSSGTWTEYVTKADMVKKMKDELYLNMADFSGGYDKNYYKAMWIVGGYDGLSFAGTSINPGGNGELSVVIDYRIRIVNLPFFADTGLDIRMRNKACTKLWK